MYRSVQLDPLKRILQKLEWPLAIMALLVVPALILEDRTTNATVLIVCNVINWCVWMAFAAEFAVGLSTAGSRRTFLRKSWFELLVILVSPPFGVPDVLQAVRGLRALRLLRLLRLVRGVAVATIGLRTAKKSLQSRGFHYVLVVALVATALGAAGIYIVEREFTIKSPEDALWWSIVTVTAVGYGDVTPVTVEGRLIALGLMFVGIGVISVFTATIASAFVGEEHEKETSKRARGFGGTDGRGPAGTQALECRIAFFASPLHPRLETRGSNRDDSRPGRDAAQAISVERDSVRTKELLEPLSLIE